MRLTREELDNAVAHLNGGQECSTSCDISRCMRLLSEDILEMIKKETLPVGRDDILTIRYEGLCVVKICASDDNGESSAYDACIFYQDNVLPGGFPRYDGKDAEILDYHLAGCPDEEEEEGDFDFLYDEVFGEE